VSLIWKIRDPQEVRAQAGSRMIANESVQKNKMPFDICRTASKGTNLLTYANSRLRCVLGWASVADSPFNAGTSCARA
jgi:hypothetical protein